MSPISGRLRVVLPGPFGSVPGWRLELAGQKAEPGQWLTVPAGPVDVHVGVCLASPELMLSASLRAVVEVLPESSVTVTVPLPGR